MAKLVHLEITADDVSATSRFYAHALGVEATPSPFIPDYMLLIGETGQLGAVMDRAYQQQPVIPWFEIENLDARLAAVMDAGGRPVGKINTIPGKGRLTYVADSNGTIFGLMEPQ